MFKIALTVVALVCESIASAHATQPHDSLTIWNISPFITSSLFLLSLVYGYGWRRMTLEQAASTRRRYARQPILFGLAIVVLIGTLLSPLASVSEVFASWHMVQHMLLMMIAAPLFIMAAPARIMFSALPRRIRRRIWSWQRMLMRRRIFVSRLAQPLVVTFIYGLVLWVWHLPVFYESALRNGLLHDFQHICFFVVACLYWRSLYSPVGRGMNVLAGGVYLFFASMHSMALGVFMTLAPKVWYEHYVQMGKAYGIDPLTDQQLAGLIMWMPVGMIYVGALAILLIYWLQRLEPAK